MGPGFQNSEEKYFSSWNSVSWQHFSPTRMIFQIVKIFKIAQSLGNFWEVCFTKTLGNGKIEANSEEGVGVPVVVVRAGSRKMAEQQL